MDQITTEEVEVLNSDFFTSGFKLPETERKLHFQKYLVGDTFKFVGLTIEGEMHITDLGEKGIYNFIKCSFLQKVEYRLEETKAYFAFWDCSFDAVSFSGGKFTQGIYFVRCKCRFLGVTKGHFQQLDLNLYDSNVSIGGATHFVNLLIHGEEGDCRLRNLRLYLTNITGRVTIGRCYLLHLSIGGVISPQLAVRVHHCDSRQILIYRVHAEGKLNLEFLKGNSQYFFTDKPYQPQLARGYSGEEKEAAEAFYQQTFFSISNSNLGTAEFNHIDFTSYKEVNFYRSKLSEISIANISWPAKICSLMPPTPSDYTPRFKKNYTPSKQDFMEERENYRQLKFVCSKHHDYIGEQYFHSHEMTSYNKTLTIFKEPTTKLIILLSKWTSNFGQSISRPLICVAVVNGFLFYLLYLTGSTGFQGYDLWNFENYINTVAKFLWYVNPLHNNEPELTGYAFIVDLLMRICSSYFLYNIIRASRRFVK